MKLPSIETLRRIRVKVGTVSAIPIIDHIPFDEGQAMKVVERYEKMRVVLEEIRELVEEI